MSANMNDHFTATFDSDAPSATVVTATRASGGTTLTCQGLDWPTDTAVHYTTYQKNTDGTAKNVYGYKGIVSGNTITSIEKQFSAADPGNDIGDYVVMRPSGHWAQDIIDGILVSHGQDGKLLENTVGTSQIKSGAVTTDTLAENTITPEKVAWESFGDELFSGVLTAGSSAISLANLDKYDYVLVTFNFSNRLSVITIDVTGSGVFRSNTITGDGSVPPVNVYYGLVEIDTNNKTLNYLTGGYSSNVLNGSSTAWNERKLNPDYAVTRVVGAKRHSA